MSEPRKKPGVAFWATVVVVVALAYPISFGPACWLTSRTKIGANAVPVIYRPMTALMVIDASPAEVTRRLGIPSGSTSTGGIGNFYAATAISFYPRGCVSKYASLGAAENWNWRFEVPIEYSPDAVVRLDEGRWKWFRDGN